MQIVLFMVPMFAIMYFLMIRPERKKQADAQALLSQLKKGDEVVLTSGIIARIHSLEEKTLLVDIADSASKNPMRVKILRQAVSGPVTKFLPVPVVDDKKKLTESTASPSSLGDTPRAPSGNPTAVPDEDKKSA